MKDFSKWTYRQEVTHSGRIRSIITDEEGNEWGIEALLNHFEIPLSSTGVRERFYHGYSVQDALTLPPQGAHGGYHNIKRKAKKSGCERDWMTESLQRYGNTIANCDKWTEKQIREKFGRVSIKRIEDKEFHRDFYVISEVKNGTKRIRKELHGSE